MISDKPRQIVHVITGLEDGGAEAVLYRLVTNDPENQHHIISLSTRGKYGDLLQKAGINVEVLGMRAGHPSPIHLIRLARMIRKQKPDLVQTWMYHSDLFGGVAARLVGVKRVFWGLHNGTLDLETSSKNTIFISRVNAFLSRFIPTGIVSCSYNAAKVHKARGYKADKFKVVPNGYSLWEYAPSAPLRSSVRQELNLRDDIPVFGMVARFDPQKDHMNLLSALAILKEQVASFRCLLVGTGMTHENKHLEAEIGRLGLNHEILLLGRRNDIPAIMNSMDVHVLSSAYGEAFPNVVCEAMACGTPCIATDVGDSSFIVGATGWTCPPKAPEKLAAVLYKAIEEKLNFSDIFEGRQQEARTRVLENFSVEQMVRAYRNSWLVSVNKKRFMR